MALTPAQRRLLPQVLTEMAPYRFALGGAAALIDRGDIDRATADLDFFTDTALDQIHIGELVDWLADLFNVRGHTVEVGRSTPTFGELTLDGVQLDFVHDWRKHPTDATSYGPRLHVEDLVASKLAALVTRLENRDVFDVASLTRLWPLAEMMRLAHDRDSGITVELAAEMLALHEFAPDSGFNPTLFDYAKRHLTDQIDRIVSRDTGLDFGL